MLASILSISAGASLGALLRWWLALALNNAHGPLPLGTLAANLLGGSGTERRGMPPLRTALHSVQPRVGGPVEHGDKEALG